MLAQLGYTFVLLVILAALYNVGATAYAYRSPRRQQWLDSAHHAAFAVWALTAGACGMLIAGFLTDDFRLAYVMENSSRAQALPFKISALWGGQGGSLLLWTFVLSCYGIVVSWQGRKHSQVLAPAAVSVICFTTAFFASMVAFAASPFMTMDNLVPPDGRGMNPLLQNYWMQIHPPTLYTGYVGCTVPFAFAVSALLHRKFDEDWVILIRRWVLFTWVVLTCGIVLGGVWAYETLGWGGYWAWDPVENASLMPWLCATAFLHSIMLQGRRGLLKNWNIALVTLTFLLSVFGTFLTRSGVVQSVHSFAESGIGGYFLDFLGFVALATMGLIWWRRAELQSEAKIDTALSREGAFMLNNWLLLGCTFAVLWGTVFPTLSEAMGNGRVVVNRSYFDHIMAPLGLCLLALTGIGPLLAWRRATWKGVWNAIKFPLLWSLPFIPVLMVLTNYRTGAATSFVLTVFVFLAITSEFWRGIAARRRAAKEGVVDATISLVSFNTARYGGYIVHLGVALMFVGLTGSSVFKVETEPIVLTPGQSMHVGEYTLRYDGLFEPHILPDNLASQTAAQITVLDSSGRQVTPPDQPMYPHIDVFKATGTARDGSPLQSARRPAIRSTLANDLYLDLDGYDPATNSASIKAYLNPLVQWIWISVAFFIAGTMIAMVPNRRRSAVPVAARAESNPAGAQIGAAGRRSTLPEGDPVPTHS